MVLRVVHWVTDNNLPKKAFVWKRSEFEGSEVRRDIELVALCPNSIMTRLEIEADAHNNPRCL
jgi:hypothetical protein